jgi:hypothetical protein
MNRYLVVTTCNDRQWTQYGRAMVRTFLRYWPSEVDLRLYPEGFPHFAADIYHASPWMAKFKAKYGGSPQYTGGSNGRDYRRDAVRFAHKVAAIDAAANESDCDILIWMDADVVTFERVTVEWLDSLFPPPATVAWLDRANTYPECGFLMFRMPEAKRVIKQVVEMYTSGSIFLLPETHDSYVFQHIVTHAVRLHELTVHSLSGEGRFHTGHPWCASRLAEKMDHLKGETRKARGMSLASDLRISPVKRTESYWGKVRAP